MPGIGQKPIGSYEGLLDTTQIHFSSTRLGWRDITVNNDFLPAGFQPGKKQAFRDHHLVVNIGEDRKSFCCSVDGLGHIPVKVMRPWDFIFVPAGTIWDWKINSKSQILSIRLQSEILDTVALHAEFGSGRHGCRFPKIVEIAEALKDELEHPTEFTSKAVDAHRTLLAIALAKQFAVRCKPAPPPVPVPKRGIAAAMALIDSWVESPGGKRRPTLQVLRRAARMSERNFRRQFLRAEASPAIELMLRRAMKKAATLLSQSQLGSDRARVQRVASLFGYDSSDFTHLFKKYNDGRAPRTFLPPG